MFEGQKPVENEMRLEQGHVWIWRNIGEFFRGHWKSTEGNPVNVFPPGVAFDCWMVYGGIGIDEEVFKLGGPDAEKRAFVVAEGLRV